MIGLIVLGSIVSAVILFSKDKKRIGAICRDGRYSSSIGQGTCAYHKGVSYWKTIVIRDSLFNNIIKKIKGKKG